MHPRTNTQQQRGGWIILFGFGLFCMLFLRLWDLQVRQGATYRMAAEQNRMYSQPLAAQRGIITDRYGDALAWNTQSYFWLTNPQMLHSARTPLAREDALQVIATDSARLATEPERIYRSQALAHAVGYVGSVTAEDLVRDPARTLSAKIGKTGLELVFQRELEGVPGQQVVEIDALGRKQQIVQTRSPQPGATLQTSLDPYLAEVARQALGSQRGAVIITDAATGAILTLVSNPGFDPNELSRNLLDSSAEEARRARVAQLFRDPQKVFFDRAVAGSYPPGSVFKIITALAGLEGKKIDRGTQVVDEGELRVGDFTFGNWYYRQYGRVEGAINLTRSLTRSNDIYFYKVAEWVGPDSLAAMAEIFGFGHATGVELGGETDGLVPTPAWKMKVKQEPWYLGNTYHFGIGQGDVLVSPIQVAQMTQAVANDGELCAVHVVESGHQLQCRSTSVSPEALGIVLEGLVGACSPGGTAFPFFARNGAILDQTGDPQEQFDRGAVACKTGTAEYGAADAQGHRKTHGWFTAIAHVSPQVVSGPALIQSPTPSDTATVSAETTQQSGSLRSLTESVSPSELAQDWKVAQQRRQFPSVITITVLVESDDENPYKEGSRDAAPVAKAILDWIEGK